MRKHLTTREVAEIFQVHPNTVVDWENAGRLKATRTAGGHRRFDPDEVDRLWQESQKAVSA